LKFPRERSRGRYLNPASGFDLPFSPPKAQASSDLFSPEHFFVYHDLKNELSLNH
jgi:hypothetical protein